MAINTSATLSADMQVYMRDELLSIAEKNVVFAQYALKATIPMHNSKTIEFMRYPRLFLPDSPAVEGETPTALADLRVQTIQAVTDQWILIVSRTDLADITVKHPLVSTITELLGLAEAELVDREIQKVLLASTAVSFANNRTSRGALTASDTLNEVEVRKLFALLQRRGAKRIGSSYVFIVDPEVAQDISNRDQFISVHSLMNVSAVYNNMIGTFLGFFFVVSNFIPDIDLLADVDWTIDSDDATSGSSFTSGQVVYAKLEAISEDAGAVEKVSNPVSVTITNNADAVQITAPTTVGFRYNIYVSTTNNTSTDAALRKVATGVAPGTVTTVNAFTTSGFTPQATPATGITVHTSYAIAKEAYGMVSLAGDNLRVLMTKNEATDSDPAAQRRKVTLKGSFKAVILNNDWFRRFESASAFDVVAT